MPLEQRRVGDDVGHAARLPHLAHDTLATRHVASEDVRVDQSGEGVRGRSKAGVHKLLVGVDCLLQLLLLCERRNLAGVPLRLLLVGFPSRHLVTVGASGRFRGGKRVTQKS